MQRYVEGRYKLQSYISYIFLCIDIVTYSYLSLLDELHHLPRQDIAYTRVEPDQVALLKLCQHLEL